MKTEETYNDWAERAETMTDVEALQDSIQHWGRMIRFVMQLENREDRKPDPFFMHDYLEENWSGSNCALCLKNNNVCENCILTRFYRRCSSFVVDTHSPSLWERVNQSKSWALWLKYAILMEEKLEECLGYARKVNTQKDETS